MEEYISNLPDCEINLCTMALVKLAVIFWEIPDIKAEVRNYFSTNEKNAWTPKTFHQITREVLFLADSCNVPIMPSTLMDGILNIGVKIYNWIAYMCSDLKLDASYAEQIRWTPLGFVDEVKLFKEVWVNDRSLCEDSPYKPIFWLACLLAQEDFIGEHQIKMIEELKKLRMLANTNNVNLEVENSSDKVYGIISTYVCYFIYDDWRKKDLRRLNPGLIVRLDECELYEYNTLVQNTWHHTALVQQFDDSLFDNLMKSISDGVLPQPTIMVRLSASGGLVQPMKYYYNKLSTSEKFDFNMWAVGYFLVYPNLLNPLNFKTAKMTEILSFVHNSHRELFENVHWKNENYHIKNLLYYCPLQNIVWNKFYKWFTSIQCNGDNLIRLLKVTIFYVKVDFNLGLPIRRYIFQKILLEIWAKTKTLKTHTTKLELLFQFMYLYTEVEDFTMLKTVLNFRKSYLATFQDGLNSAFELLFRKRGQNAESFKTVFNKMLDWSKDLIIFVIKKCKESDLLMEGKFVEWEKFYSSFDFLPGSFRDNIDPIECLYNLTLRNAYEFLEKFVKWWHESEEDQLNLKEKFKKSSYPSKIVYLLWLRNLKLRSSNFLRWLFVSDDAIDAIAQFKREKLSIIGLLEASFENVFPCGLIRGNLFHLSIEDFINFYEITPENVEEAKEEIKRKMENYMLDQAYVENIDTLNYLMNWTSINEESRKKMFKKLEDSGKLLQLCQGAISAMKRDLPWLLTFYNKWLKLYANVSVLKNELISIYESERDENFITKLSLMYETLERGEDLTFDEMIFDFPFTFRTYKIAKL